MLRVNRSITGMISLEKGVNRQYSWQSFQWMYCEPFQVKCCVNYKSSKVSLEGRDFKIPINKESKFVDSTFDLNEFLSRKEKESQILIEQSQFWVSSLLSVDRAFSSFQEEFSQDFSYNQYCLEKNNLINAEIKVFEWAQDNKNLNLFLRVSRIQKSNERLGGIRKELLEKYCEARKKK